MKKKLYALAAAGLIATAMSAGYLIGEQNKSSDNYKVVDIKKITDAEFDFASYQKNKMKGDVFIENGYFTPVGDKYIKLTLTYRNDEAQDTRVLIFDKKLKIIAAIIFLENKYLENKYEIESSITEKDGVIYYPEIADVFEPYSAVKGVKSPTIKPQKALKAMISINGYGYQSIDDPNVWISLGSFSDVLDVKTRYFAKSTFFDSRGSCKETALMIAGALECPENIYEVKLSNDSLFISKRPIDFEVNDFAVDISRHIMKSITRHQDRTQNLLAKIEPITKDGMVSLISTPFDGFVMTVNNKDEINISSGVIAFNKTLAINKEKELKLNRTSPIDKCKYALLGRNYETGINKIISIDTCKLKSI